jgi:hypothetical protein
VSTAVSLLRIADLLAVQWTVVAFPIVNLGVSHGRSTEPTALAYSSAIDSAGDHVTTSAGGTLIHLFRFLSCQPSIIPHSLASLCRTSVPMRLLAAECQAGEINLRFRLRCQNRGWFFDHVAKLFIFNNFSSALTIDIVSSGFETSTRISHKTLCNISSNIEHQPPA